MVKAYGVPAYWLVEKGDSIAVYEDTLMSGANIYYFDTEFKIKDGLVHKVKIR